MLYSKAAEADHGYRRQAAICMALAGFGISVDSTAASAEQKALWRSDALALLRELPPDVKVDPALSLLRESRFINWLPEEERKAWLTYWGESSVRR